MAGVYWMRVLQGYDFFDLPMRDNNRDPTYLGFIKRDESGQRSHMVAGSSKHALPWDKLLFRDYLLDQSQDHGGAISKAVIE